MPIAGYILTAIAAYLLGSIPTGFLVAKAKGIDIRTIGSGNIGATNVLRALGKPAGVFVLVVDALKGWLAVTLVALLFRDWDAGRIIAGVAAILGHNYTCWLHFKGGKGIATSAGVLVALVPWALLAGLGVWIIVFILSRYVSLASICACAAIPIAAWLNKESITRIIVTAALAALAIYKHKANIRRLLEGTENRFGAPKQAS